MKARENPFRSGRIEALAFRAWDFKMDEVLALLDSAGGRGAIVGPEGSGKTTLLEALRPMLESRGYSTVLLRLLDPSWPSLPPKGGRRAFLADGAEALGRSAGPVLNSLLGERDVLVTTAQRPGLLPTIAELRTSPDLLLNLTCDLLEDGGIKEVAPSLPALWTRHQGNLRACFRELYDRWAERDNC